MNRKDYSKQNMSRTDALAYVLSKLEEAVARRLWLSKITCWKQFQHISTLLENVFFPDFLAARDAIPAKVYGCWKVGPAFGNAPGHSPPRPPQPSAVFLMCRLVFTPRLAGSRLRTRKQLVQICITHSQQGMVLRSPCVISTPCAHDNFTLLYLHNMEVLLQNQA